MTTSTLANKTPANTTPTNNTRLFKSALFGLLIGAAASAAAEVVVIVHPSNTAPLGKEHIRQIFLGKDSSFPNNLKATPIELAEGETRKEFLKNYLNKSETQLQHLWSIKAFTGKGQPPKKFNTDAEIKAQVSQHPDMIGYIDSSHVDDTVKVIR